jgi:hypothetical protein
MFIYPVFGSNNFFFVLKHVVVVVVVVVVVGVSDMDEPIAVPILVLDVIKGTDQ